MSDDNASNMTMDTDSVTQDTSATVATDKNAMADDLSTSEMWQNREKAHPFDLVYIPCPNAHFDISYMTKLPFANYDDLIVAVEWPVKGYSFSDISAQLPGKTLCATIPVIYQNQSSRRSQQPTTFSTSSSKKSQKVRKTSEDASSSSANTQDSSGTSEPVASSEHDTTTAVPQDTSSGVVVASTDSTSLSPSDQTDAVDSAVASVPSVQKKTKNVSAYKKYCSSSEAKEYRSSMLANDQTKQIYIFAKSQKYADSRCTRQNSSLPLNSVNQDAMLSILTYLQLAYHSQNPIVLGRSAACLWNVLKLQTDFQSSGESSFEDYLNKHCVLFDRSARGPRTFAHCGSLLISNYLKEQKSTRRKEFVIGTVFAYLKPNYMLRTIRKDPEESTSSATSATVPVDPEATGQSTTSNAGPAASESSTPVDPQAPTDTSATSSASVTTFTLNDTVFTYPTSSESCVGADATTAATADASAASQQRKRIKRSPYLIDTLPYQMDEIFLDHARFTSYTNIPVVAALIRSPQFVLALKDAATARESSIILQSFPDVGSMSYYTLDSVTYIDHLRSTLRNIRVAAKQANAAARKLASGSGDSSVAEDATKSVSRASRVIKKKRVQSAHSAESGINRPSKISESLKEFIQTNCYDIVQELYPEYLQTSEIPRTKLVSLLAHYFKARELLNPTDKRKINVNEPLQKLFNIPPDFNMNRFNINTLVNDHVLDANGIPVSMSSNARKLKKEKQSDRPSGDDGTSSKKARVRFNKRIALPRTVHKKPSLRSKQSGLAPDLLPIQDRQSAPLKKRKRTVDAPTAVATSPTTVASPVDESNVSMEASADDKNVPDLVPITSTTGASKRRKRNKTEASVTEPAVASTSSADTNTQTQSKTRKEKRKPKTTTTESVSSSASDPESSVSAVQADRKTPKKTRKPKAQ